MPILLGLLGAWFGFANPVYNFPALVLLFAGSLYWIGVKAQSPGQALKRGWIAGSLAYTASLYWIAVPVHYFGPLPWALAIPCPILVGMFLGLFCAVFVLSVQWSSRRLSWWSSGLCAGLVWTCLEYLRSTLLTGFPWLTLPQPFTRWPLSIQSVNLVGAFGLAGIMVVISAWAVCGLQKKTAWPALCLLVLLLGWYGWKETKSPINPSDKVKVSIIQGNIDQDQKWASEYQRATVQKYLDLSQKQLHKHEPDLIVWPETAMPFYLQQENQLSKKVFDFADKNEIFILTGAPGYTSTNPGEYDLYNRAFLINQQGDIADIYDKEHLVPFGEYVPLHSLLPFLDKLVAGISDFSSGINTSPLIMKNLALGPLICYEVIFPGLVQKRVEEGANCLVNISNDAWFGRTAAPRQHLNQAILRAVEQNRAVIRATNTGISSFIDSQGFVQAQTGLFKTQTLFSEHISTIDKRSFYSRHYLLIKFSFFLLAFLFLLKAWLAYLFHGRR